MRILITGASGFLGRRAAVFFEKEGYTVLAPTHAQLDITDAVGVNQWFAEHQPQAVLHCAAVSDTGACQKEPERTAKINVDGSVNLAKAAAEIGAKFVFCSSDQVYAGSTLPGPHGEDEPLTPGNVYAAQNRLAEERCAEVCPSTVSLRLSWMYATDIEPNEHGHLMTSLPAAIRDEAKTISWPVYDRRGITDVAEVVKNLPLALNLPAGVYNFGAENDSSTHDTMEKVIKALGWEEVIPRVVPNALAFADAPRDIRMDTAKAESFDIKFSTTTEGLVEALRRVL
jgi:dTDP-4-dehydrorhamnose reductase